MKKFVIILAAVGLILAVSGTARAAVTFNFDPNDLLDLYGTDYTQEKEVQPNPRRLRAGGYDPNMRFDTFLQSSYADDTDVQPKEYNTYLNWRTSLGASEGLAYFNIWLANGVPAQSWGETLVFKPGTSMSASAAAGWSVQVIGNPWVDNYLLVEWVADDSSKYLRPTEYGGADIGEFSFSADLYVDTGTAGWDAGDSPAVIGQDYRIWFGSGDMTYDDAGWGSLDPAYYNSSSGLAFESGHVWEGVLALTAVPEPASVLVWCLLGAGSWLGMRVWRRRRIPVGQQSWSPENRQAIHEIITR